MDDFRIPLNTGVSQNTMRLIDQFKVSQPEKLSRGEVIDRAVALLSEQAAKKAGRVK